MADGTRKAVECVRPGDTVLSKYEKTGRVEVKEVRSTSICHIDQTLPEEGHGFAKKENVETLILKTMEFLKRNLQDKAPAKS